MYRHACIAVMTLAVPPAAITLQDRRIASAVDEQQYLIPLLQVFINFDRQRFRDPLTCGIGSHIDEAHLWRGSGTGPLTQLQMLKFASQCVVQTFKARRRAAEHHGNIFQLCTLDREIPGRIAQAFLLFERGVVLFVDDDDSGIRQRQENCRACPDDNRCAAAAGGSPGQQSFPIGHCGMHGDYRAVEPLLKAAKILRGQSNFRNQQQALSACLQYLGHDLHVDLSFA